MPGLVVSIQVGNRTESEDRRTAGGGRGDEDGNVLLAERDGTIGRIDVKKGDNLALNDVILEFA